MPFWKPWSEARLRSAGQIVPAVSERIRAAPDGSSCPETAVCCDSYFIEVPDGETPSTSTYYYRNINPNDADITLNVSDCYGVLDPSETTITIQSLVDDEDYFAIYEPMSSNIVFKNGSHNV